MPKNKPIPDTPECVRNHLGIYACNPDRFAALHALMISGKMPACSAEEMEERRSDQGDYLVTESGVAIIPVKGVMQRGDSKFGDTVNTQRVRKMMRSARDRADVSAVLLHIDSPGGTVAGQTELIDDLDALRSAKTTWAAVEEMACSAGYWLAARCDKVFANRLAEVGNIGCYCVAFDYSKQLEKEGVRAVLVSSGKFKGLGADYSVPPEMEDEMLARVNEVTRDFVAAVADGRGMPVDTVEKIADGKSYSGRDAIAAGLIDEIGNFDRALDELTQNVQQKREEIQMADENKALGAFQALADSDGYEFAKANFGKPEHEIELARKDAKIAKAEEEKKDLEKENEDLKKRVSDLEDENEELRKSKAEDKDEDEEVEDEEKDKNARRSIAKGATSVKMTPVPEKKKASLFGGKK